MSKALLQNLENSFNSGELGELIEMATSFKEVQVALGYSGNKGQYTAIIRQYLANVGISFTHFSAFGKAKKEDITKHCEVCGKSFTRAYSKKALEQRTCSYACSNTLFRSKTNNPNYLGEKAKRSYRQLAFDIILTSVPNVVIVRVWLHW